jgi:hypothetical protein
MNSTDHQTACNQSLARIIGRTVRSSGSRALVAEIAKESISTWAKDSTFRKKIAAPALWLAGRLGKPGTDGQDGSTAADAGAFLTELARKVNTDRASATQQHDGKKGEAIDAFLRSIDFGEILEMVEGADPRVIEGIRTFNEQLWKYPAKVGALTMAANALLNTSIKATCEALKPIDEQFSPDLLADLLLSTVRELKGTNVAVLVNTVCELIRRIHTGSLRLGKGGRPLFQVYLTALLNDCLPVLKPDLLKKARIALAEDGEACANALADAMKSNPAIPLSFLSSIGAVQSSRARTMSRKLRSLEETDQAGLDAAVSESVSDLDTYEIAGLINAACSVLERIHQARPDIVSSLVGGIVDSLDTEQARRICSWLIPDLADAVRPLIQAIAPEISGVIPAASGGEQ